MEFLPGSYARFTAVRPVSDVDITTLLAQPEVADRISSKLTKYYDKITGVAVDGYVSPIQPIDLLLQALGRANRHPATWSSKSIKIDLSASDAAVDLLAVLGDPDQQSGIPGPSRTHHDLYRSLPKKLSRAERNLNDPATVERLRRHIVSRGVVSSGVATGKSMFFALQLLVAGAPTVTAQAWPRIDIGRMLVRRAKIILRRMLGQAALRPTPARLAASDVDFSIESHRSRAPDRARKTSPILVFRELAAV
ncbi:hypothetical protein ACFWDN_25020 [Micromonospora chalcea]